MLDEHRRSIEYLRLSITDLCNLRCKYCMPEQGVKKHGHSDMLRVHELVEIVAAAAQCGIKKVRITGGEPLVHRGVVDICKGIREIPQIEELCLTTNGVLLQQYAGALKDAGVDRLNISLDTLREDRYARMTRCGSLSDVIKGFRAAKEAGFTHTKINTVLIGGFNDDEIADFVALTEDKPLEIRFIELMPLGESANWERRCFLSLDAVRKACPALVYTGKSGVAELYRIPGYRGNVGLIRPMSHKFCSVCNRIRVTADGMLKPCLHSDVEISLRGLRGQALVSAIRQGILAKPTEHHMEEHASETRRTMNRIGG